MEASVREVVEAMAGDPRRPFALADLAAGARLPPRRFSRLFRAATGTTPARFLKSLRRRRARDLPENSCLATREIIRRVGCGSEGQFARDFKRHYGVTPGQLGLAAHLARACSEPPETEGAGEREET